METNRIVVKKVKTLSELLQSMKIGEVAEIKETQFRYHSVYNACVKMRKKGFGFDCSQRGLIGSCLVTRTA